MSIVSNHHPEIIGDGPTDAELVAMEAHAPRRLPRLAPPPDKMVVPVEALADYEAAVMQLLGFADAVCGDLGATADPSRVSQLAGLLKGRLREVEAAHRAWSAAKWSA